ncbi:HIT family protein [Candidatus Poribacteria bacterium]|nr:MAG: HIT family protein [Candidatus Poribacteria bacterium]
MNECIFCKIVAGEIPSNKVYEDDEVVAFMDINPANPGHTLVVPKKHFRNLLDIDEGTAAKVMEAAVKVAKAIKKALNPDGLNLFHASEKAAFQTVFHFHIHVIPRWEGDDLVEPWKPKKGDPERIAETAAKIREAMG